MKKKHLQDLTMKDFIQVAMVPWDVIKDYFSPGEYKRFIKWMKGQTCSSYGVYYCDLKRYLYYRQKGVKNPTIID